MSRAEVLADKKLAEFEARFGVDATIEAMEAIADAGWNRKDTDTVKFSDIHQINACNHVYSGVYRHAGEEFGFIIESGDNNGTVILGWGDPEDVGTFTPPAPVLWTFVPRDNDLREKSPAMYGVYLAWTKAPWFQEKVRSYNYDKHFAPGGKTEEHYRSWADRRGLKVATLPRLPADGAGG